MAFAVAIIAVVAFVFVLRAGGAVPRSIAAARESRQTMAALIQPGLPEVEKEALARKASLQMLGFGVTLLTILLLAGLATYAVLQVSVSLQAVAWPQLEAVAFSPLFIAIATAIFVLDILWRR